MEYWKKAGEGESGLQDLVRNSGLGREVCRKTVAANRCTTSPQKRCIFLARMKSQWVTSLVPCLLISVIFQTQKCYNSYRQSNLSQARHSQVKKKCNIIFIEILLLFTFLEKLMICCANDNVFASDPFPVLFLLVFVL